MCRNAAASIVLGLFSVLASGCCCVQTTPCGDCGIAGAAPCGPCGPTALGALAACRGGCGDVYVDEWVSQPPVADNCTYPCGGCGVCRRCQPIRNIFRILLGTPYQACCPPAACGPVCDTGCSGCASCDGGGAHGVVHGGPVGDSGCASCNAGHGYTTEPQPMSVAPGEPMPANPEVVPTPAPDATPNSARRLNPARRRLVR